MKQFRLFTGNRLESLAEILALMLREPLRNPLDKETIVVQSKGMERWVSMELARYHGVCANVRFLFPNEFVYEYFQKAIPDLPENPPYDIRIMTWKIMKILSSLVDMPAFDILRAYLKRTGESLRRFQIASRIAKIYDQYLIFRPEMIRKWETGKENNWQAILWRELIKEIKGKHRAAIAEAFFRIMDRPLNYQISMFDPQPWPFEFPERISVFGISSLPGFHIQILERISRFTQVNLFLMNPCQEYWGDILSNREKKRLTPRNRASDIDREYLYLEEGNSLLGSMGMLGRDFFHTIAELSTEEHPYFEDPEGGSLLLSLQSDILNFRERGSSQNNPFSKAEGKTEISEDDRSVQVHICHSQTREIEVLHDRLLDMFESDPDLTPGDILVMTPDIEEYSPYIEAVFALPANDPRRIPFSIADRSVRSESRLADTFMRIIDLTGSRFGAAQVVSILEYPPVYQRFELSEPDLDLIRKWIRETRIRWGIDARNRGRLGLPELPENTWKTGLERLLLGYAMPGRDEAMFAGILPYDNIEGNEADILGKFLEFTNKLFSHIRYLGEDRRLAKWSDILKRILDEFFMPDEETETDIQTVRQGLNDLADMERVHGFDEKIDIQVIRTYLSNYLEEKGFGFGFITGGVTFCAMLPMRSIPFKVICLIGMNSDAYPRQSRPVSFDLMARKPKRGDPYRRNDDRYLFLESLLSARERLYISYVGQSIKDNSQIPPSVLVSELMDYIEKGFEIPGEKIAEHLTVRHRLQGFSPDYFRSGSEDSSPRLFSYSRENLEGARHLLKRRKKPRAFVSGELSPPEAEWKAVDIEDLCRFFRNPARFLLNKRLGIYLDEKESILEEKEAFSIEGLEKYFFEARLMGKKLEGHDLRELFRLKQAAGELPHGTVGECLYEKFRRGIEVFVEKISPYMADRPLNPLEIASNLNGFRVSGRIGALYSRKRFHYRYATVKPNDHLKTWILHLALNCRNGSGLVSDNGYPRTSIVAGSDSMWEYGPVENGEDILETLLEKYWQALRKPLHFFPKTSWEYAWQIAKRNQSPEYALKQAKNRWEGHNNHRGELMNNPYFKLCFKDTDPLDSEFQTVSLEIFGPMLMNQKQIEGV